MALTGLDIYKQLPKTNCRVCGFPTCLAFAMQLAAKKVSLDKCPKITDEAKANLEGASQPPIKLVTIGTGDKKIEVGNETVLFRHEETFYHPTGVGFVIDSALSDGEISDRVKKINDLKFDRVGQHISVNLIAVKQSTDGKAKFPSVVKKVAESTDLALVLMSEDPAVMSSALESCSARRPLIYAATSANFAQMAELAKKYSLPLAVLEQDLDKLAELTQKISAMGVTELVLDTGKKPMVRKLWDLTQIRRLSLKKTFRPLGYPTITITGNQNPYMEASEAAIYISKYSSLVLMEGCEKWEVLPLLTLRQDIYTDPQKPSQVEPNVYEIGNVTDKSPVVITTNFSITYYTVEAEVESSKVPAFLIACNAEGMSVLTAWAAEKFTAESITATLEKSGMKDKVSHRQVIIPGYVAVLSGKLEELSGWKVKVGPREASGVATFLRNEV
ncbi:MAG: acetyl-CoA decarbonylase/synthase complex subunit gamma [Candidatus Omnitrophica bacterium]|nr:acetyl-CoA decarbonylase/synthase complex subunit gamma [Candidatus Omnitrophota bacterium]